MDVAFGPLAQSGKVEAVEEFTAVGASLAPDGAGGALISVSASSLVSITVRARSRTSGIIR